MTDKDLLSSGQRKLLCDKDTCEEHSDGEEPCPIPLYKSDLNEMLETADTASSLKQSAEPMTATGIVERSDG